MAASPTPTYGRTSTIKIAEQAAFETPASGAFRPLRVYSEGVAVSDSLVEDRTLGGQTNNDRDATDPAPGLARFAGDIACPFDLETLPFWLRALFGAEISATTESGTTAWVFHSGGEAPKLLTLEHMLKAELYKVSEGVALNTWRLNLAKEAGYVRQTFGALARKTDPAKSAPQAGSTLARRPRDPVAAKLGVVRIDGVQAGYIRSCSYDLSNNITPAEYADGGEEIGGYDLGDTSVGGRLGIRLTNGAMLAKFDGATPFRMELEWAKSATRSVSLDHKRVFAARVIPVVNGPGAVEFDVTWEAKQQDQADSPAPAAIVTVKNGVSAEHLYADPA